MEIRTGRAAVLASSADEARISRALVTTEVTGPALDDRAGARARAGGTSPGSASLNESKRPVRAAGRAGRRSTRCVPGVVP